MGPEHRLGFTGRGCAPSRLRHLLFSCLIHIYLISEEHCPKETRGDMGIGPRSPGPVTEEEIRIKPARGSTPADRGLFLFRA